MKDTIIKELKKYYVYELVNKKSGCVFYVGKGTGERALQHKAEALNLDNKSEKCITIRKILAEEDNDLIERVIGRYETEAEAYAVESTLIHWVYGHSNLTNRASGHGSNTIRNIGDNSELEGIDIPERVKSFDGSYTKEFLDKRDEMKVVQYMQEVKKYLESELNLKLSEVDIKDARFAKLFFYIEGVKISIYSTNPATKSLNIMVEPINYKKENKEIFSSICERTELISKGNGTYANLSGHKKTESLSEIVKYFIDIKQNIEKV